MFRKKLLITLMVFAAAGAAAGLLAGASSGAAKAHQTIGLVLPDPATGAILSTPVESGAATAASALGDDLVVIPADGPEAIAAAVKSLIARHAGAIVVSTDQGAATVKRILPALAKAREAGIPTVSYEQRIPGTVWVSQSRPAQYARALADALASQMKEKGQYAIVPCRPAETIVQTWLKAVKSYVPQRYPRMKRVAVVYGGTGNGPAGTLVLRPLLKAHPHLRGLIFLCPSEAYTGPPQLIRAHKVGKVFTAGNGGDCPPLYKDLANSVRHGAAEMVCAGDPVKLGYLVVWAADYVASGHTFEPGQYDVGGPVGTVSYYAENQELPLGQPLTITKANVDQYAG